MADRFVTHETIARHVGLGVGTVQKWGKEGDLGEKINIRPALYPRSALKLAEKRKLRDLRVKLTNTQVLRIKALAGKKTQRDIAEQFKVSPTTVCQIINGKRRVNA